MFSISLKNSKCLTFSVITYPNTINANISKKVARS